MANNYYASNGVDFFITEEISKEVANLLAQRFCAFFADIGISRITLEVGKRVYDLYIEIIYKQYGEIEDFHFANKGGVLIAIYTSTEWDLSKIIGQDAVDQILQCFNKQ